MGLIYEAASGAATGQIFDEINGIGFQPATLSVFIYDRDSGTALLGTAATPSSLSPVATYVDSSGNLTYYILPAYNSVINANNDNEIHVARFTWTWTAQGQTQTGKEELQFNVTNLTP